MDARNASYTVDSEASHADANSLLYRNDTNYVYSREVILSLFSAHACVHRGSKDAFVYIEKRQFPVAFSTLSNEECLAYLKFLSNDMNKRVWGDKFSSTRGRGRFNPDWGKGETQHGRNQINEKVWKSDVDGAVCRDRFSADSKNTEKSYNLGVVSLLPVSADTHLEITGKCVDPNISDKVSSSERNLFHSCVTSQPKDTDDTSPTLTNRMSAQISASENIAPASVESTSSFSIEGAVCGASQNVSTEDKDLWFYKLPPDIVYGPFSTDKMFQWSSGGYLKTTLLVRRKCDRIFSEISILEVILSKCPFLSNLDYPPILDIDMRNQMLTEAVTMRMRNLSRIHVDDPLKREQSNLLNTERVTLSENLRTHSSESCNDRLSSQGSSPASMINESSSRVGCSTDSVSCWSSDYIMDSDTLYQRQMLQEKCISKLDKIRKEKEHEIEELKIRHEKLFEQHLEAVNEKKIELEEICLSHEKQKRDFLHAQKTLDEKLLSVQEETTRLEEVKNQIHNEYLKSKEDLKKSKKILKDEYVTKEKLMRDKYAEELRLETERQQEMYKKEIKTLKEDLKKKIQMFKASEEEKYNREIELLEKNRLSGHKVVHEKTMSESGEHVPDINLALKRDVPCDSFKSKSVTHATRFDSTNSVPSDAKVPQEGSASGKSSSSWGNLSGNIPILSLMEIQQQEREEKVRLELDRASKFKPGLSSKLTVGAWTGANVDSQLNWVSRVGKDYTLRQGSREDVAGCSATLSKSDASEGGDMSLKSVFASDKQNFNNMSGRMQSNEENKFYKWAESDLLALDPGLDVTTFVSFLVDIDNFSDVQDYMHSYLGDDDDVTRFSAEFMRRKQKWKKAEEEKEFNSKSITKVRKKISVDKDGKSKKTKSKGRSIDNSILGFSF